MLIFLGWSADYDRIMIDELKKTINSRCIIFPEGKTIFKLNKLTGFIFIKVYLFIVSLFFSRNDILVFKDSDGYGYHRCLPFLNQRKLLIVRNIISRDNAIYFRSHFNEIYSFDMAQCEEYGFNYMPQIFPFVSVDRSCSTIVNGCYFVGVDKGRIDYIELVADSLLSHGIFCDFSVIMDNTSKDFSKYYVNNEISYRENIEKTKKQKYLLEVNQVGQTGLTLRALESIFFEKKLISNNSYLRHCDFYHPSRIFIFSCVNDFFSPEFEKFMNVTYKPIDESILRMYNASDFFGGFL